MQCPAESKRTDIGVGHGYSTFSLNVVQFDELNEMPVAIDLARLNDGDGIEMTLLKNKREKLNNYNRIQFP